MTPRERADAAQRAASDPAVSAFVAASAGSGKTKLLTDRLLRLMLAGADLARILCLTYTRAGAAEMALRLRRRLAGWVAADDAALDRALEGLATTPSAATRQRARALFAQVLDLPGGMRIMTIHAFCQHLLQRFPLEAAQPPRFALAEDAEAVSLLTEAREETLAAAEHDAAAGDALAVMARSVHADAFSELLAALAEDRAQLAAALAGGPDALIAAQRAVLGVAGAESEATVIASAIAAMDAAGLRAAAQRALGVGKAGKHHDRARDILAWLDRDVPGRTRGWDGWCRLFRTKEGEPLAPSTLASAEFRKRDPEAADRLIAECNRVGAVAERLRAVRTAETSAALVALAHPVLRRFADAKAAHAVLDYQDLIAGADTLLSDPGAAWVLYKLDGGLDHLLLDEVQDTAPGQWDIARRITAEFFAGSGARGTGLPPRTIFAVGDRKQSIFGFQGADPARFQTERAGMNERVTQAGLLFRDLPLDVSFRSTAPVLRLVDAVFANPVAAAGVTGSAETLRHHADRDGHAGSVEVWPLAPRPKTEDADPWTPPEANRSTESAPSLLARTLAGWIARETGGTTLLESRGDALRPGDVLVLVRRRTPFVRAVIRALKDAGVPVAGADRMVLIEQPAVADLIGMLRVLLLPEDDLALAEHLVSPLGGLDQDDLIRLCPERGGTLWSALRDRAGEDPRWREAHENLAALMALADYVSPHELLTEALGPLGGRARLLRRLGPEAIDPIGALLEAAQRQPAGQAPSLEAFLHRLSHAALTVKREPELAGDAVRIMTVHGAKGLQAPLVVLADTTAPLKRSTRVVWTEHDGRRVPLWAPRRDGSAAALIDAQGARHATEKEEMNRLLYVALTRAEDRLLVCGAEPGKKPPDDCWYRLIAAGMTALGRTPETLPPDHPAAAWGPVLRLFAPQRRAPGRRDAAALPQAAVAPPDWMGSAPDWRAVPPPAEPALPQPLAPSRPEGAEFGPHPSVATPWASRAAGADRFGRGRALHSLLQVLPDWPEDRRRAMALAQLAGTPDAAAIVREALDLMEHPFLRDVLGPGSRAEVPIVGVVGGRVVGGLVDRLLVTPTRVVLVDWKTARDPPAQVADVPVAYLRQLAAYAAVLAALFPGRAIAPVLVWTRTATVMPVLHEHLFIHAPGADALDPPPPPAHVHDVL